MVSLLEEGTISPFDHGLLTGDGVFETLRVYGGTPFAIRRHLDRLAHSARGLGLRLPAFDLREAMEAVVAANGADDARSATDGYRWRGAARL